MLEPGCAPEANLLSNQSKALPYHANQSLLVTTSLRVGLKLRQAAALVRSLERVLWRVGPPRCNNVMAYDYVAPFANGPAHVALSYGCSQGVFIPEKHFAVGFRECRVETR